MAMAVQCRSCGTEVEYSVNDAGRKVPCPECGRMVRVPAFMSTPVAPPPSNGKAAADSDTPRPQRRRFRDEPEEPPASTGPRRPRRRVEEEEDTPPVDEVREEAGAEAAEAEPADRNFAALAALLCGSLAVLFASLPGGIDRLTIPLAGFGFLVGLGGLGWAVFRHGRMRMPVVGLTASFVALFFGIAMGLANSRPEPPPPEMSSETRAVPIGETGTGQAPPIRQAKAVKEAQPVDASAYAVQQGNMRLRVTHVEMVDVRPGGPGGGGAGGKQLQVHLRYCNSGSGDQRLAHQGWAGDSKNLPVLTDGQGNQITPRPAAADGSPDGSGGRANLGPGKGGEEVLVFDLPRGTRTDALQLELPASAFGGKGKLCMKIPPSMLGK